MGSVVSHLRLNLVITAQLSRSSDYVDRPPMYNQKRVEIGVKHQTNKINKILTFVENITMTFAR